VTFNFLLVFKINFAHRREKGEDKAVYRRVSCISHLKSHNEPKSGVRTEQRIALNIHISSS
jgi:hypothetical protein